MTAMHANAHCPARNDTPLSADNIPPRHIIVDLLRRASARLGLTPPLISTLDAMLSFLPARRDHHVVFASNATLVARCNGVTERTLRRHIARLLDLGLVQRRDSANRKRFTRHSSAASAVLRFGFDLGPMFRQLQAIATFAAEEDARHEHLLFLKTRLRAAVQRILERDPEHAGALHAKKLLRRSVDAVELDQWIEEFSGHLVDISARAVPEAQDMTARNGQNVRHHHNKTKDINDAASKDGLESLTLGALVTICPDAAELALSTIRTEHDVIRHGQVLAPMLGIDRENLRRASERHGPFAIALTIWALVQQQDRLQCAAAYFRTLTQGPNAAGFDPVAFVRRLAHRSGGCRQPTVVRGQYIRSCMA